MSTPSALTVIYPPSFQNSFWTSPSYRPGAQSLYSKLQAGLDENQSILAFVAHRAQLEYSHAEALATPNPTPSFPAPLFKQAAAILSEVLPIDGVGSNGASASRRFAANASATWRAFRMIQDETNTTHANAHGKVARHLEKSILEPFGKWAADHRRRVTQSWQHVDATLARFERQKGEVDKLELSYENKCRAADEAEDDARFAPIDEADLPSPQPSHASHGTLPPPNAGQPQRRSVSASADSPSNDDQTDPDKIKRRETIRKQFGFSHRATSATHAPPLPLSKESNEFAGVKLPPLPTETEGEALSPSPDCNISLSNATSLKRSATISALVSSAVDKMPAPLKAAVGGVVSGEPRRTRLRREADNAEKVYEEAVRNLDRTRCQVEEVLFEHYGLTQQWELDRIRAVQSILASYNQAVQAEIPILHQSSTRAFKIHQGLDASLQLRALIRQARTGPFHPTVQRFQPYHHDEISLGRKVGPKGVAHGWLIKNGGFGLDLSLVDRFEYLERLERQQTGVESTEAVKAEGLATLPPVLVALLGALNRAYADDQRWNALAKALAAPKVLEEGQEESISTGVDAGIVAQEKRKTWILEVPLAITHRLRDALIAHLNPSSADLIYGNPTKSSESSANNPIPEKLLDSYDPPVLAACVKLWLLELQHSLITEELWDQIDSIYQAAAGQEHEALAACTPTAPAPAPGPATEEGEEGEKEQRKKAEIDEATKEKIRIGVLQDLRVVLNKLAPTHLACLEALFSHLRQLLLSTSEAAEGDAVYANKLGLAIGRALLRPKRETGYTVTSQIGTLVVVDLLLHFEQVFPEVMEKKRNETMERMNASPNQKSGWAAVGGEGGRPMPTRKRTKPVDQRISRSSIGSDLQQGAKKLIEQMDQRGSRVSVGSTPAVPIVPAEHSEKPQPRAIDTQTNLDRAAEKKQDDLAAPTPLNERVLFSSTRHAQSGSGVEAETGSISSEKGESQTPIPDPTSDSQASQAQAEAEKEREGEGEGEGEDKPLSNVARLSRQFNTSHLGSGGSSAGESGHSKRTSMGGAGGGTRGPRPVGARTARMSGQFSSSSNTSSTAAVGEENDETISKQDWRQSWSRTIEPSDALVGDD
ncbi:hypothetical protein NDA14_003397 [Ustilago hordei]|nr:hypothetical protein NDA14_003397 [Ustilago hordei]